MNRFDQVVIQGKGITEEGVCQRSDGSWGRCFLQPGSFLESIVAGLGGGINVAWKTNVFLAVIQQLLVGKSNFFIGKAAGLLASIADVARFWTQCQEGTALLMDCVKWIAANSHICGSVNLWKAGSLLDS